MGSAAGSFCNIQRCAQEDTADKYVHGTPADERGEEWMFSKVGQKIKSHNLGAAKNILPGQ
eukprot:10487381-Karenia_brevis.AAC.1